MVYRGVAFVPTFNNITLKYTYQNISFSSGNYILVGGTDYTIISVTNNLNIGEASVLIEEDRVLITCDDNNIGSCKVIEANGGVLENKVENTDCGERFLTRRYWIDLN